MLRGMTDSNSAELAPLVTALKRFESAQSHYADFGASDTEPDAEWHVVLRDAVLGHPYPGTRTEDDWQLFTRMTGVKRAAARLTREAKAAHKAILGWRDNAPAKQWRLMETFLRDYCWRVSFCTCED